MNEEQIKQLRARIVRDLNLGDLPESAQDLVIGGGVENILLAITRATIERMSPVTRTRFDELSAAGDQQEVMRFLEEAIPGYDKLVENVITWVMSERKQTTAAVAA